MRAMAQDPAPSEPKAPEVTELQEATSQADITDMASQFRCLDPGSLLVCLCTLSGRARASTRARERGNFSAGRRTSSYAFCHYVVRSFSCQSMQGRNSSPERRTSNQSQPREGPKINQISFISLAVFRWLQQQSRQRRNRRDLLRHSTAWHEFLRILPYIVPTFNYSIAYTYTTSPQCQANSIELSGFAAA